jgi:hypothetical protein
MSYALDDLEQRVGQKFAEAAASRVQLPTAKATFDVVSWLAGLDTSGSVALPDDWPQFPREQWVSYPNKRTAALLFAEHLLDRADELTDEQWSSLCLLMHYGGKTRVS